MQLVAQILTGVVAALHVYFLVLEMFLWTTPFGRKTFARSAEEMEQTKVLAGNQGLYNGFLAAGLVWSMFDVIYPIRVFFLGCVVIAGLYGGATASKKIYFVQMLPGVLALVVSYLAAR
jgi:putative membrane protein